MTQRSTVSIFAFSGESHPAVSHRPLEWLRSVLALRIFVSFPRNVDSRSQHDLDSNPKLLLG